MEKKALFCVYNLKSHLKCSFKSILEKKHQNFFRVVFFMSYMKRLLKCPFSKKPPMPRKNPGCAPVIMIYFYVKIVKGSLRNEMTTELICFGHPLHFLNPPTICQRNKMVNKRAQVTVEFYIFHSF